jgi:magnesium-protoporphyrin O-methyltransferase
METTYRQRRGEIEQYFDRTAFEAWARLTSTAPVGRVRATVRAGRDRMRETILSWLPNDLTGARVLDAGCGTGALATLAAQRGAHVVATDLSPTLIALAQERLSASERVWASERPPAAESNRSGSVEFVAGDMLDPALGEFDYVVGMDSLIHYEAEDATRAVTELARRTRCGIVFTFAPKTTLLAGMHAVGKLFPRGNRSPAIVPVNEHRLARLLGEEGGLQHWSQGRTARVSSGFYISQAMELVHA